MKFTLIIALVLAHFSLYISFVHPLGSFWVCFTIALFTLIIYALIFGRIDWKKPNLKTSIVAIISGIALYALFLIGKKMMVVSFPSLIVELENLYRVVKPEQLLHYFALFLIVIPGEEIFWRGYIFQRLLKLKLSPIVAIILATIFYTSANIFAGSILLLLASIIAGFVWTVMYYYTKNIWSVLISHLVFDLLLLVVFPLL